MYSCFESELLLHNLAVRGCDELCQVYVSGCDCTAAVRMQQSSQRSARWKIQAKPGIWLRMQSLFLCTDSR
ncbi:hypothetical protein CUJ91_18225 [Paraburkholderia graminis]|nr:hypothetical protein CUJ91_18225 [Paraburkholderia graminis]